MSSNEIAIMMKRDNYIANKKIAKNILNDILKETFDIVRYMEFFQDFKRSNQSIRELTLNILFVENLPAELLEESNQLQEYKLYGDVNVLEFKDAMSSANAFVDDLFQHALKIIAYIETRKLKTIQDKLEIIKDVIKLPITELDEKVKYNLAFQTFPTIHINVLSGYEAFAETFVDSIIADAALVVLSTGESPKLQDYTERQGEMSATGESPKLRDYTEQHKEISVAGESPKLDDYAEQHNKMSVAGESPKLQDYTEQHKGISIAGKSSKLQDYTEISPADNPDAKSIMKFPLIRDFTIQVGQILVDQIVSKWCFNIEWKYFIQYADYIHDTCHEFHNYEVIFSIPTPSYPIPQATASVFFTITINKLQHEDYPIEVSYNMEGSSYIHSPDITSFNQDWLYAILCSKIKFFKRIYSLNTI